MLNKIVTGLLGLSLLGGCAGANLRPGEQLTKTTVISDGKETIFRTTELSDHYLRAVAGMNLGTVEVYKMGDSFRVSGNLPNSLSPYFARAYTAADVDGNGIVDTPEAEALYLKTAQEKVQK